MGLLDKGFTKIAVESFNEFTYRPDTVGGIGSSSRNAKLRDIKSDRTLDTVGGGLGGALAGAGLGGIVHQRHFRGQGMKGALIGGALGTIGGALAGRAQNKAKYNAYKNGNEKSYYQNKAIGDFLTFM